MHVCACILGLAKAWRACEVVPNIVRATYLGSGINAPRFWAIEIGHKTACGCLSLQQNARSSLHFDDVFAISSWELTSSKDIF